MLLTKIRLVNYRCYADVTFDCLDRLAVFIGENDVGKTQLMNAVACLVGPGSCAEEDYRDLAKDQRAHEVVLEGVFQIEAHDTLPRDYCIETERGREFRLKKRFTKLGTELSYRGMGYSDERFDDFRGADNQKALLKAYHVTPAAREDQRKAQLNELVAAGTLARCERELRLPAFAAIQPHMPRVERICSADFRSPDEVVNRVLRGVAASVLKPVNEETGQPEERADLRAVRREIESRLNDEVQRASDALRRLHGDLRGLGVHPSIDFTRAVSSSSLNIDLGEGLRPAGAFGKGTNNRLWMGLLEWEREVAKQTATGSVLRLYDEPDVNLHYDAQRALFNTISELSVDAGTRTQCFVCTHAVTLIDRADPEWINLVAVDEQNARTVRRISGSGDGEYAAFMSDVGQAVGLSNTALLYERAFIVVEGESEAAALPIIYRNLYGRSLSREGIVLVNLHTCSAWKTALELLLKNRLEVTHLLLDNDCQDEGAGGNVDAAALAKLGAPPHFHSQHVSYIGAKEYEDAFDAVVIAAALDAEYPRTDGGSWAPERIEEMKRSSSKFSEDLKTCVRDAVTGPPKGRAKKEHIAAAVARHCRSREDVPDVLLRVFDAVRRTVDTVGQPAGVS